MSAGAPETTYDVVVPTVGRPSLDRMLSGLASARGPAPNSVVIVDDRSDSESPLAVSAPEEVDARIRIVRSGGRGPAAARNVGWRLCSSEWVVFLDDDVVPSADWRDHLAADLSTAPREVAGVQGRLEVPLPDHRPPSDWERNVAGLATARWATADMAYRRWALELVGGFDERFPRAFREDADLALRISQAGLRLVRGTRVTSHPPGPERFAGSLSRQAGNQDDPLMYLIHGKDWRGRAGVPRGRRPAHLATVTVALLAAWRTPRGRPVSTVVAIWLVLSVQYAWSRLREGPRQWRETADMVVTSALIPPLATAHWLYGWCRGLRLLRRCDTTRDRVDVIAGPVEAVLFDRDGTLIRDVPYNSDPDRVVPMPHADEVLRCLRDRGLKTGVITNQSGVGRGLITDADTGRVNERVERLLGRFDTWQICPHSPGEGCECRKPAPGMILKAAADLGVDPVRCVVVGDIGSDIAAARAAGAGHILIPTPRTLPDEIASAGIIAADLAAAYQKLLPYLNEHP